MARERVDYIDGPCLASAIRSGAEWVASKRIHLNEINVFPVPDGDTGTNLTMTLKAAADAIRGLEDKSLGEVSAALSHAVLLGARGNAGIILAQFIRGFAGEVQGAERLYPKRFVEALRSSVRGAYESMAEPTEGTVLTVVREAVEEVARLVDAGETDYAKLLEGMHAAAQESLARTPDLLPVLKEAGVVDAGGEGFVDLLEGILRLIRGEEVEAVLDSLPDTSPSAVPRIQERDLKYRYCTEFLLEGPDADVGDVKVKLAGMGGSLVVVGSLGLVRAHIHTNRPEAVFDAAAELGSLSRRKVDDMREQHREFIRSAEESSHAGTGNQGSEQTGAGDAPTDQPQAGRRASAHDRRRRSVRIVTDSTADLSPEVAADLGITVVPLTINFEDVSLRSGVDLTSAEFYERLQRSEQLPTTSQPTPHDFTQVYEELSWETRVILSIHLSSAMSGTFRSATVASEEIRGVEVRVIDTRQVSGPLGLTVIAAAEAAREGADLAELTALVHNLSVRGRVIFTVGTLDFLVKGGRIGRAKGILGKLMGVKPILTVEDGVVTPMSRARGEKALLDAMVELARPELAGGEGGTLGLVHGQRPEMAQRVEDAFLKEFAFDDVRTFELGGIVGTHVGPGTWGVSYFRRRPAP